MPKDSREYSYFHGEKNVRNGVVVECNWHRADQIAHCIADFGQHECAYTLRSCFKTRENPDTRSQFYKDERPYEVFENVNFEADEVNIVAEKVARNQKKWECFNMGNDIFAVKDVCVFSHHNPRLCYSELAGDIVPYTDGIANEVLQAHVPFDCFLQFTFTSSKEISLDHPQVHRMTYKVYSIQQVNPDRFGLAYKTPWLKLTQSVYEDNDPFKSAPNPEKEKNLPGIKAFALTGKKVFVPSRPRWRISLAHNKIASLLKVNEKNVYIKPHMPLMIDVRFNSELNRFIVYDSTIRPDPPLPKVELIENKYHKATLERVPECQGFFRYRDLGLVFDAYGVMASFYHASQKSQVIADFTYVDPDERSYTPLGIHRCYEQPQIQLESMTYVGIFIGNSEFYCPYLHFLILRAEAGVEFKVGGWYFLSILKVHEQDGFADIEATESTYEDIPHKKVGTRNEFLVPLNIVRVCNIQVATSPYLGAIGITENELARCDKDIKAAAIQFPLPQEDRADRPQVRPRVMRLFKSVDQGKAFGSYK